MFYTLQVNRSSLMVGPNCGPGLNGATGPEMFNAISESPENSTDSDDEISVTDSELQLPFCTEVPSTDPHPEEPLHSDLGLHQCGGL